MTNQRKIVEQFMNNESPERAPVVFWHHFVSFHDHHRGLTDPAVMKKVLNGQLDYGHFAENIIDESVDVKKIAETQMMIEAVRNAISRLNAEERDIIERLYFYDETLSSIARKKKVSYQAVQWRKNSILKKLKLLLEEILK